MVMYILEKLKEDAPALKSVDFKPKFKPIFQVHLPSVTCTTSGNRDLSGFVFWSRWIEKCYAVFQYWQATGLKISYSVSFPFLFLKKGLQISLYSVPD